MHGGLEDFPGEQAAFLAVGGEAGTVEGEHVFGGEVFGFVDGFALHLFEEHRGRGLADDAALAAEVGVADFALVAEFELDADDVAAERVVVFVSVGGVRQVPTVERVLVMVEDVFLVEFFFVERHAGGASERCNRTGFFRYYYWLLGQQRTGR